MLTLALLVGPAGAEIAAQPCQTVVKRVVVEVYLVAPVAELIPQVNAVARVAKADLLVLLQLVFVPALAISLNLAAQDVVTHFTLFAELGIL